MRLELITTDAAFLKLDSHWNSTLQRSRANTIFLTWEWISVWWDTYRPNKELLVLVAYDERNICQGIAPCYLERRSWLGRTLRILRFLGDGSFDSDYLDFIVAAGMEPTVLPAFLNYLATVCTNWHVAHLNEIPHFSSTASLLPEWAATRKWLIRSDSVPYAAVSLPGDWNEYLASLRPRFRTSIRACLRNISEWPGGIEQLRDATQIDQWLEELFSLHGGRWELRHQQGVFHNPAKRRFYSKIARLFLERNWLHFARWRAGDSVVASQFGFIYDGTYYHLQEGFDRETTHVSPGVTLRAASIADLIARNIQRYDFLGGIGRHKTDWAAEPATAWRYSFAPPTAAGFAYIALPTAAEHAKEMLKRRLPGLASYWAQKRQPMLQRFPKSKQSSFRRRVLRRPQVAAIFEASGLTRLLRRLSRHLEISRSGSRLGLPRLQKASTPKIVILCYHRVGTGGVPLYSSLSPEIFEAQMRHLSSQYQLVSMDEVCELLQTGSGGHAVAVTFDDGYLGTYTEAFPILSKYHIPATVFLTVGAIETGEVAWYDRVYLAFDLAAGDKLDLLLDRPRRFFLSSRAARFASAAEVISYLRTCSEFRRREVCRALERCVLLPNDQLEHRMMTWQQVREMQQRGVVFGSHTMTHPAVSMSTPEELQRELIHSKDLLEQRISRNVSHFAFPFGKRADCGVVPAIVRQYGYRSAVTTEWGVNTPSTNPYALRRVSLPAAGMSSFALSLTRLFLSAPDTDETASVSLAPCPGDTSTRAHRAAS